MQMLVREEIMIRTSFAASIAVAATAWISSGPPALSQEETDQRLGTVHFDTSCNEAAQRRFDRGMRYQHSFWYRESKEIFEEVLKADPECGIAYWGIALSLLNNPHAPPPAGNLPLGLAAIQKAKSVGAKSQRERDFIDALLVFYTDYDKIPHGARVQAYLKAIEAVAQRNPQDDEAQIFYAITLNVAASANDKTYANQLKGAAILEPIFRRQPRHPGVAHYLIHLYDAPPLAEKGLDAAKRYSEIAPAAPHAQHMPSHIFTRVGYWKESIAANVASVRAAKAEKEFHDQLHAMDYLVYAYLQLGQDAKARAVIDEMTTVTGFTETFIAGPYALAASPARYMVERGDWRGAAQLQVRPSPLAHVQAITHFARALGAAGRNRLDALCRGQIRRRPQGHASCRRCRGQDRETPGNAWGTGARARTLRRDAARARNGRGGARRIRSNHQEGAKPLQRVRRRREGGRPPGRQGESQGLFPEAHGARKQCRQRSA
jgi:tetratricopeptide (TPR) repeat protein